MSLYGRDGKKYDNYLDKSIADNAWNKQRDEQQRQNSLLAEQNRLIREQANVNAQLERERLDQERELQIKQMEHDEKMRILKLFDDIGLSKEQYDTFVYNLIEKNLETIEKQKLLNKDLLADKETQEQYINQLKTYLEKSESEIIEAFSEKFPELKNAKDVNFMELSTEDEQEYKKWFDNYEGYKEKLKDIGIYNDLKLQEEKLKKAPHYKKLALISSFATFITMILYLSIPTFLPFVIFAISLISCIYNFYKANQCLTLPDKIYFKGRNAFIIHLNNLKSGIDVKEILKKNIKEQEKKFKDIETKIKENDNKINQCFDVNIKTRWNDFIEFRKKHYNPQLEKLLLDLNLKEQIESLGIEYIKINNNNKINNGKIDDYIIYFDEFDNE